MTEQILGNKPKKLCSNPNILKTAGSRDLTVRVDCILAEVSCYISA